MSCEFLGTVMHWIASTLCKVCVRSGVDYDLKMHEMAS